MDKGMSREKYKYLFAGKDAAGRLERARLCTGLEHKEFRELIGAGPSYYSQIKSGEKPLSVEYAIELKRCYGIDMLWLLTGEGDINGTPVVSPQNGSLLRKDTDSRATNTCMICADTDAWMTDVNTAWTTPTRVLKLAGLLADLRDINRALHAFFMEFTTGSNTAFQILCAGFEALESIPCADQQRLYSGIPIDTL
jgi:hypothetical protein